MRAWGGQLRVRVRAWCEGRAQHLNVLHADSERDVLDLVQARLRAARRLADAQNAPIFDDAFESRSSEALGTALRVLERTASGRRAAVPLQMLVAHLIRSKVGGRHRVAMPRKSVEEDEKVGRQQHRIRIDLEVEVVTRKRLVQDAQQLCKHLAEWDRVRGRGQRQWRISL